MDLALFDDFRAKAASGRRKEAAAALAAFIRSLDTLAKKRQFTDWLLDQRDARHMAQRYELRTDVLHPVLLEGYAKGDARSTYWLAMIPASPALTGGKSPLDLLKQCLSGDWEPARVRQSLLAELLRGFKYAVHEWPAGILEGADGASYEQCLSILGDVVLARELDADGRHTMFLDDFEGKVRLYQARLRRKT